ncbi:MAG: tetracycline resistance MFS efflux pump [Anaerolineales bacterium]
MKSRQILILFIGLFIVMVGFGIIIPILPYFAESMGATSLHLGLLMASYSLMQFIFAPIWGRYSDRVGRRPVLLLGLLGFGFTFFMFAMSSHLWMLFAARILGGILTSATLPTAMAYIGDSTSERERGGGMGLMGAAMGLGMIFGPAIGGYLGILSFRAPFLVAAGLGFLTAAFAFFMLPESLPPERRVERAQRTRRPSLWAALTGKLGYVFFLSFLIAFAMGNLESMFALFVEAKLGFGSAEVGTVFTVVGIIGVVLQGVVVGKAINRWGEIWVSRAALLMTAVGYLLVTRATNLATLILFVAVQNLGSAFLNPSLSSYVSKRADAGQGTAMGLQQSFMSLGRVAGPLWGGAVFSISYHMPYYTGAVIMLLGFLGSLVFLNGARVPAPQAAPEGET